MSIKRVLIGVIVAVAFIPAYADDVNYTVSGIVADSVRMVYLGDFKTKTLFDSTTVEHGLFRFAGKKPRNAVLSIVCGDWGWLLFNDGTPIHFDNKAQNVEGSELNQKLYACWKRLEKYLDISQKLASDYLSALSDTSASGKARTKAILDSMKTTGDMIAKENSASVRANRNNLIPAVFLPMSDIIRDADSLQAYLDPAAPYYDHPLLDGVKARLAASEQSPTKCKPGTLYTDIAVPDTSGTPRWLSEWCGKGNYILIDFWASWCGPCRMDMPNVLAAYEKYRHKGFCVLGISLDANVAAWRKAIAELGMEWPQLSDLQGWGSPSAIAYSIRSIPASILVGPDGTITDTGLRGEQLGLRLKTIYGF